MKIVELTFKEFDDYAKYHPLNNYCQTSKYAQIMTEYGYSYDYIGYVNEQGAICAASLILTKKVSNKINYGYAPKGFLVNYYDTNMLRNFLNDLKDYYKQKDFIFIKFNPEIITGETSKQNNFQISYNGNVRIIDDLKSMDVKRRLETKEFELMMPRFGAYLNLKLYDSKKLGINYRKKLKGFNNSGFTLKLGDNKEVKRFYDMIKNKTSKSLEFYQNFFNIYSRDNLVDLIFITLDTEKYLASIKDKYEKEKKTNDKLNYLIQQKPIQAIINKKMKSDKTLDAAKAKVEEATQLFKKEKEVVIATAFVIKHFNRIIIYRSAYNEEYNKMKPNHILYNAIFERYKPYFKYCDLGGVTGTFDETSKYYALNKFKADWNSTIYEFAGEFDLVCSEKLFKSLIKSSFIEEEFDKQMY